MICDIQNNYQQIVQQIAQVCKKNGRNPSEIQLITVTKTKPVEVVQSVLDLGYTHIGENRVQEVTHKIPLLSGNKIVHFIGHLQSNKVAKVVPFVDWIHSIDNEKLLFKVDQYCNEHEKKINILIQVNTSHETSKSGCHPDNVLHLIDSAEKCSNVVFRGLMTIGPLGGNERGIRRSFETLRKLKEKCIEISNHPVELSMGMSDDFLIAIEEGSTMIRLGTLILGRREYT